METQKNTDEKAKQRIHQEIIEFQGDDLFDVKNYFWEFFQDGIRQKHYIYLNPLATAPTAQVQAYDRYTKSVRP